MHAYVLFGKELTRFSDRVVWGGRTIEYVLGMIHLRICDEIEICAVIKNFIEADGA